MKLNRSKLFKACVRDSNRSCSFTGRIRQNTIISISKAAAAVVTCCSSISAFVWSNQNYLNRYCYHTTTLPSAATSAKPNLIHKHPPVSLSYLHEGRKRIESIKNKQSKPGSSLSSSLYSTMSSTPPSSVFTTTSSNNTNRTDWNNNNNSDTMMKSFNTGFLNAKSAAALDEELMTLPGYTLEQLMELAGLAVAEAVFMVLEEGRKGVNDKSEKTYEKKHVLIVCGPGNNGGDGLVAGRHLVFFGYNVTIVYPKLLSIKHNHYTNLVKQCQDLNIPIITEMPTLVLPSSSTATTTEPLIYDAIVDAIFGFSFQGLPMREPFHTIMEQIRTLQQQQQQMEEQQKSIIFSVDIPSGWIVDDVKGVEDDRFVPDVLISLTAPKLCSKTFRTPPGRHFVGGRFLPSSVAKRYMINMPTYPGVSQVMEIT